MGSSAVLRATLRVRRPILGPAFSDFVPHRGPSVAPYSSSSSSRSAALGAPWSAPARLAAVGGLAVALGAPLVAIGQAGSSLLEYRRKHADAPRAASPSRGIVVAEYASNGEDDEEGSGDGASSSSSSSSAEEPRSSESKERRATGLRCIFGGGSGRCAEEAVAATSDDFGRRPRNAEGDRRPPLRLLVIGDSLAFGIGQSHSATPVLPESMARSLSRRLGGRTVCWTCHGKPGLSAAQLVREIEVWSEEERAGARSRTEAGASEVPDWEEEEDDDDDDEDRRLWRVHRSRLVRAFGPDHDPQLAGNYDVVVVMIGMGDLKGAALPFLRVNDHENHGEQPSAGTFRGDLERVLEKLRERRLVRGPSSSRTEDRSNRGLKTPLVLLPALPAKPVPIFRRPPLRWFVWPLVEYIDGVKAQMARSYSASAAGGGSAGDAPAVSFVPEPTDSMFLSWEDGIGPLRDEVDGERIVLSLTDMGRRERAELEGRMRAHWGKDEEAAAHRQQRQARRLAGGAAVARCRNDAPASSGSGGGGNDGAASIARAASSLFARPRHPGSTVVSTDDIHPNDSGYDFWGRCIASHVADEWRGGTMTWEGTTDKAQLEWP